MNKAKKSSILIVLTFTASAILTLSTGNIEASPRYGLGVILGDPTGLSAKAFFTKEMAADLGISYSFREFFHIYSDYLYHFENILPLLEVQHSSTLHPYLGIGAGLRFSTKDGRKNSTHFFARIPLGLEWMLTKPSLGIFAELVPAMGLIPETYGDLYGGIGIRYYF